MNDEKGAMKVVKNRRSVRTHGQTVSDTIEILKLVIFRGVWEKASVRIHLWAVNRPFLMVLYAYYCSWYFHFPDYQSLLSSTGEPECTHITPAVLPSQEDMTLTSLANCL